MEVRCKVCRFKFDIQFDNTQTEMVTYCPRCGTPQVVSEHQLAESSKQSVVKQPAQINRTSEFEDKNPDSEITNKDKAVVVENTNKDTAPTPRASLDVEAYTPTTPSTSNLTHNIFTIVMLILLGLAVFFAYKYYKHQQLVDEQENQSMEIFGGKTVN